VTYQDRCPPGTTSVSEKDYRVKGGDGAAASPSGPLTLYVVPDCDSCKQVEEFLALRGISVEQKNVNDDIELQNELKEVAGDLRVPVLVVNDDVIVGYNRGELISALSKAGYQTEIDLND
jgi:glutaredoxin